jgi:peptidyl-prolyl cis-trans isomerase SurA
MKKKVDVVLCFLGVMIFLLGGVAQAAVDNRIVAIVNNDIITYFELEKTMKQMAPQNLGPEQRAETQKQLLFQMIDQKLIDLQVKKLGLQVLTEEVDNTIKRIKQEQGLVTPEDFAAFLNKQGLTEKELKQKIKDQILRFKLISREIGSKIIIPQERVKEYYQKNKSEFKRVEGVHLAHIILRTGPDLPPDELTKQNQLAQEILERLKKGENFSELARTYSQDATAAQGGDLGMFKLEEIEPSLREVVSHLKPGEVSPVIQTPQGLQIVTLVSRNEAKEFTFDEVKDGLQERLFQTEVDQRFSQWLQQLKDRSYIQVLL